MALDVISAIKADGTGDYTSLTAWEAAVNVDLTAATGNNTRQIAELYDAETVASFPTLDFNGGTHDYSTGNYLLIRAATGNKYNPLTGVGATLINAIGETAYNFVIRPSNYLVVNNTAIAMRGYVNLAYNGTITLNSCVFKAYAGSSPDLNYGGGSNAIFNNCLCICTLLNTGNGAGLISGIMNNCTIIAKTGYGSFGGDILVKSATCTNVTTYNGNTKTTYSTYYNSTTTTCAQNNNGSASLGAGNIDNLLTTDFTDYANGDYSVAQTVYDVDGVTVLSKSQLIDAGTDLSAQFTTDIVGTVRG